jgi:hypothetical protein
MTSHVVLNQQFIFYTFLRITLCDKIDIIFGNFVLFYYVCEFRIIFGNFALYLGICYYIWEFRIIFGNLLLYLGISHYICMFAIIFFNFAFNIRNWSYIFGLDNKYIRLIDYCPDYCPSWRAIVNGQSAYFFMLFQIKQ